MPNPARLQPLSPGAPFRIEVDAALSDELIEDLAEAGFDAQEAEGGGAVIDGGEVCFVEVARAADGSALEAFLGRWNVKERGD